MTGCNGVARPPLSEVGGPPPSAAAPTFSPAPGTYASAQTVTISDATPGATIYYTTDGTTPTASSAVYPHSANGTAPTAHSAVYSGPIRVDADETIEAMAVAPGDLDSGVAEGAYSLLQLISAPPTVEKCAGGILPAGSIDTDLEINGVSCTVDGSVADGAYVYRNVNIWGGGVLNFADAKIDFHAHSILVENGGTLEAGVSASVVGPITIWLYGAADDGIPPIGCKSSPTCGVPVDIWGSNPGLANKPSPPPSPPVTPPKTCNPASKYPDPSPVGSDCFYQYDVLDPGGPAGAFFSRKSLALSYGGTIYLRGAKGIRSGQIDATPSDSGTSWVRLTDTLKTGDPSFHVDRPVPTWGPGDHIVLTSTDYLQSHNEEVIIQNVESDSTGTKITLQAPVQFPHNGAAYDFSSLPATRGPQDDPNRPATLPSRHLETRA
ncbi:MAG TPA: chitobiase/beta-hexosaminidase C-terminal domain-containing protein, partial [Bryobacteraceae bacterium]